MSFSASGKSFMPRMLDLIRVSALPSNVMQAASKGSLSVPPLEMIEILVYLANHNKIFSQQAQLTLAGWDEVASRAVASDPSTPKEVLDYMISAKNLRPALLSTLLENPSVSQQALVSLAESASREVVEMMQSSERVQKSAVILEALKGNPHAPSAKWDAHCEEAQKDPERAMAASAAGTVSGIVTVASSPVVSVPDQSGDAPLAVSPQHADSGEDDILDEGILAYLSEYAGEISAEGEKAFQPIGGFYDAFVPGSEEPLESASAPSSPNAGPAPEAPKKVPGGKKQYLSHEEERGSALQKISKLDIKGRIQLAMKGTKEERSLLVRDGTKVVALAVLESPKISDSEVEKFATQKNVLEAVLRAIPMKRRFIKNYAVVRNLTFNPRTPLDVSLALIKHLLITDLRHLSGNKEVSETVRKLALKMFRQKLESGSKRG
jgi:hypothetical protein